AEVDVPDRDLGVGAVQRDLDAAGGVDLAALLGDRVLADHAEAAGGLPVVPAERSGQPLGRLSAGLLQADDVAAALREVAHLLLVVAAVARAGGAGVAALLGELVD